MAACLQGTTSSSSCSRKIFRIYEQDSQQTKDLHVRVAALYKEQAGISEILSIAKESPRITVSSIKGKKEAFLLLLCIVGYQTFPLNWFYARTSYKENCQKMLSQHLPKKATDLFQFDSEDYPDYIPTDNLNLFLPNLRTALVENAMERGIGDLARPLNEMRDLDLAHYLALCALFTLRRVLKNFDDPQKNIRLRDEDIQQDRVPIFPFPVIHAWVKNHANMHRVYQHGDDRCLENRLYKSLSWRLSILMTLKNGVFVSSANIKAKFDWIRNCYDALGISGDAVTAFESDFIQIETRIRQGLPMPALSIREVSHSPIDVLSKMGMMIYALPRVNPHFFKESVRNGLIEFWSSFKPSNGHRKYIDQLAEAIQASHLPFYKGLEESAESALTNFFNQKYEEVEKRFTGFTFPLFALLLKDFQTFCQQRVKQKIETIQRAVSPEPPHFGLLNETLEDIFRELAMIHKAYVLDIERRCHRNPEYWEALRRSFALYRRENPSCTWQEVQEYIYDSIVPIKAFSDETYAFYMNYFKPLTPKKEVTLSSMMFFAKVWLTNDLNTFKEALDKVFDKSDILSLLPQVIKEATRSDALHYFRLFRLGQSFNRDRFKLTRDSYRNLGPYMKVVSKEHAIRKFSDGTFRLQTQERGRIVCFYPQLIIDDPDIDGGTQYAWARVLSPVEKQTEYMLEEIMFDSRQVDLPKRQILSIFSERWGKEFPEIMMNEPYALSVIKRYKGLSHKPLSSPSSPLTPLSPFSRPQSFPLDESSSSSSPLSTSSSEQVSSPPPDRRASSPLRIVFLPLHYTAFNWITPEKGVEILIESASFGSPQLQRFRDEIITKHLKSSRPALSQEIQNRGLQILMFPLEGEVGLRISQALLKAHPHLLNQDLKNITYTQLINFHEGLLHIPLTLHTFPSLQALKQLGHLSISAYLFQVALHKLKLWKKDFPLAQQFIEERGQIPVMRAISILLRDPSYCALNTLMEIAEDLSFAYSLSLNTYIPASFFMEKLNFLSRGYSNLDIYSLKEQPTLPDFLDIVESDVVKAENRSSQFDDHHDLWRHFGLKTFAAYPPDVSPHMIPHLNLISPLGHEKNRRVIAQAILQRQIPLNREFYAYFEKKALQLLNHYFQQIMLCMWHAEDGLARYHFQKMSKECETTLIRKLEAHLPLPLTKVKQLVNESLREHSIFKKSFSREFYAFSMKQNADLIARFEKINQPYENQSWSEQLARLEFFLATERFSPEVISSIINKLREPKVFMRIYGPRNALTGALQNMSETSFDRVSHRLSRPVVSPRNLIQLSRAFCKIIQRAYAIQTQAYYAAAWYNSSLFHENLQQREIRFEIIEAFYGQGLSKPSEAFVRVKNLLQIRNPLVTFDECFARECAQEIYAERRKIALL